MKEGLIAERTLPNGVKADIWCVKHKPEDAFTNEEDVAAVQFRFTTTRHTTKAKTVRRRFNRVYPKVRGFLQNSDTVKFEFNCALYEGKRWNIAIAHCLTQDAAENVIERFTSCIV